MQGRLRCITIAAASDVLALGAAYFVALGIRNAKVLGRPFWSGSVDIDWAAGVMVLATLASFSAFGLYMSEAHVHRPLLLRSLGKAVATALIASSVTVYFVEATEVNQSRFMLLGSFGLFLLFVSFVRLSFNVRAYRRRMAGQKPITLVVGDSARSEVLKRRLSDLCGFTRWRSVVRSDDPDEYLQATNAELDAAAAAGRQVKAVFIDQGGMHVQAVLPLVEQVRARHCCEVYLLSELAWPSRTNGLLGELFEAPVVRVRRRPANGAERRTKRVLDVAFTSLALVLLAVPMAVIAAAIKLTSPGPVFYRQERIGLHGSRFWFVKFRTMRVGDHEQEHRDYVRALIAGDVAECNRGDDEEHVVVLKMAEDSRVTSVGRFLRRYSLDELPQFWNVLRGDLSLVGPRPPLPYEVEAYSDWHRQRLRALPGISGLWQVGGRSRVSFDEMVFQDLFYAANQSPLLDAALCLRTPPAIINGRGAM